MEKKICSKCNYTIKIFHERKECIENMMKKERCVKHKKINCLVKEFLSDQPKILSDDKKAILKSINDNLDFFTPRRRSWRCYYYTPKFDELIRLILYCIVSVDIDFFISFYEFVSDNEYLFSFFDRYSSNLLVNIFYYYEHQDVLRVLGILRNKMHYVPDDNSYFSRNLEFIQKRVVVDKKEIIRNTDYLRRILDEDHF